MASSDPREVCQRCGETLQRDSWSDPHHYMPTLYCAEVSCSCFRSRAEFTRLEMERDDADPEVAAEREHNGCIETMLEDDEEGWADGADYVPSEHEVQP